MKKFFFLFLALLMLTSCHAPKNTQPGSFPPPATAQDEITPATRPEMVYPSSPQESSEIFLD